MTKSLPLYPLKINQPLASQTYFKIGGPADWFYEANSAADLVLAIQAAIKTGIPYFILGGGSNILVGDKGFRGLVIKNRSHSIRPLGSNLVAADSGVLLNQLVSFALNADLAGLEAFLSIPGTVGGALYNNSHYRPEKNEFIGNYLYRATLIDQSGSKKTVDRDYFQFGYDWSVLQQTKESVISASFLLQGGNRQELWDKATALVRRRNQRQPIGIACSGCTFRNPAAGKAASALIDQAGLKGFTLGRVRVSPVHAAFIENLGRATAQEVLQLIDHIRATVKEKFGVTLELEIFLVGEF